ncbi:PP2C family protein-serine/threonine phosphatase [Intrasporangium flavum]|uniref:PP2C family protein-serine/threonine phosphatase n=1 Tax=Intrasporangium flavum TaxID=1428657 RepID=UPI00096F37FC|nr:protein phosphatase 2C domain-containing protein [Intrasporangium flavum]
MTAVLPTITVGLSTDVGRVRKHNEDSARAEGTVFVVADGMGGHAAGEVASRIAAESVVELSSRPVLQVRDIVAQVAEANRRILESAARHPEQTGMGTTVAGLAVVSVGGQRHWAVFNIGDSRVYRLLDGALNQVTVDHSEVWELVERGLITPEEAHRHPARNIVTRSLGRDPMGVVDTWVFPPYPGEVFVICSDGLSNELSQERIEAILLKHPDAEAAAEALVAAAVEAGGHDNVTAIVVALQGQESDDDVDEDTTPRETVNGSSGESRS